MGDNSQEKRSLPAWNPQSILARECIPQRCILLTIRKHLTSFNQLRNIWMWQYQMRRHKYVTCWILLLVKSWLRYDTLNKFGKMMVLWISWRIFYHIPINHIQLAWFLWRRKKSSHQKSLTASGIQIHIGRGTKTGIDLCWYLLEVSRNWNSPKKMSLQYGQVLKKGRIYLRHRWMQILKIISNKHKTIMVGKVMMEKVILDGKRNYAK